MSSSGTERKHFFTGRQVTTMVVGLMATVVLLPGAVWAVDAFTNVAIQDPVTGTKASVGASNALKVGDNVGPLTVDGTVIARPAKPTEFFSKFISASGHQTCDFITIPPAGKTAVLTTVNIALYSNPSPGFGNRLRISTGTNCGGIDVAEAIPPGKDHITLPFDPGLVSSNGFSIYTSGNLQGTVTATGYFTTL
jgi:hypothetical protein